MLNHQLTLDVHLPDDETFETLVVGENQQLTEELKTAVTQPQGKLWYVHAENGIGCSHLLHAICDYAGELELPAALIPLKQMDVLTPEMLDGLEAMPVIAIDDVDRLCGNAQWEFALFDLINRIIENRSSTLILCSSLGLQNMPVKLPDLASRLSWGTTYRLNELSEMDKQQALMIRAEQRGIHLSEEASQYLIARHQRDMKSLLNALDVLDKASMQQQRKLTIPFIKQVFNY